MQIYINVCLLNVNIINVQCFLEPLHQDIHSKERRCTIIHWSFNISCIFPVIRNSAWPKTFLCMVGTLNTASLYPVAHQLLLVGNLQGLPPLVACLPATTARLLILFPGTRPIPPSGELSQQPFTLLSVLLGCSLESSMESAPPFSAFPPCFPSPTIPLKWLVSAARPWLLEITVCCVTLITGTCGWHHCPEPSEQAVCVGFAHWSWPITIFELTKKPTPTSHR